MKRWLAALAAGVLALLALVLVAYAILSRTPRFAPLPPATRAVVAGDPAVRGRSVLPFEASYDRGARIMGAPLRQRPARLRVQAAGESLLVAVIQLGEGDAAITDSILLERATLRPISRRYPSSRGPVQLVFRRDRIVGKVTDGTGATAPLYFAFDAPVFEVSLLELVLGALALGSGDAVRLAWDNLQSPADAWADVRVLGEERIAARNGETYDTRVIQVRFASGNLRQFWIADRPPYKIRLRNYQRGRAAFTWWELRDVTVGDGGEDTAPGG